MSRYGDNCEAHDMPHGECIHCVREELSSSIAEIDQLNKEINRLRQYEDAVTSAENGSLLVWNLMDTNCTVIKNDYWQSHLEEIDRLKAELESKDKAIKLLQGHCNALMDTEGKLAQWNKGHLAGMESAGYYQKQADDMIRQLRKELSDENASFTEEIMNLERQLAEAKNREAGMTEMYEELYEHHFKEHHTPDYVKIEELEKQLVEARAENDMLKETVANMELLLCRPKSCQIRQEAARECYNLVNTFATPDIVFVLDAIKAKFGLEG